MIIVKPTEKILDDVIHGRCRLPYQYMNWWLYQRGCDTLLKNALDYKHPAFSWLFVHVYDITVDLMGMIGMQPDGYNIDDMLNPEWRTQ